jgi:hypothetical protein
VSQEVRNNHLNAMDAGGVREVRLPIPWQMIEPDPPGLGGHDYRWGKADDVIAAMARRKLRAEAMIAYAPEWGASGSSAENHQCRQSGAAGLGAGSPASYALAAKAVARRYGVGGNFWDANDDLPYEPVRLYEIWNAPNTAGAWCPAVDPEGYGVMFAMAVNEIRDVQPQARVVVGGVGYSARTQGGSVATREFLARMVAARPAVTTLASAVAVHDYPGKNIDGQLNHFPKFREWVRDAGFPNSVPMLVNEIGFSRAGALDFTEAQRVRSYENVMTKLSRTNCNISGILQYAWTTRERDHSDAEEWFGIAKPGTSELYPSGHEFLHWLDVFRGRTGTEAPMNTIEICPGMPLPDQDGDGVVDELDRWPLNPNRPGGGGGGTTGNCTITGTNSSDVLFGTSAHDVICGKRGPDLIRGLGAKDRIRGGRGSDFLYGGRGRDRIKGGRGDDRLVGGPARDRLQGGPGDDTEHQ